MPYNDMGLPLVENKANLQCQISQFEESDSSEQ